MPHIRTNTPSEHNSTRAAAHNQSASGISQPAVQQFRKGSTATPGEALSETILQSNVNTELVIQMVLDDTDATDGTRVMVLDMKQNPVVRGTIKGDVRDGSVLVESNGKKRLRKLINLRLLTVTEAANDLRAIANKDVPDPEAGDIVLDPTVNNIISMWGWSKTSKTVAALGNPNPAILPFITALHDSFGGMKPKIEDRTVYIKTGNWDDAEGIFRSTFGAGKQEGSLKLSNRKSTVIIHGITAVLREESSATDTINATIELQIGGHHAEYKWERTAPEKEIEEARVTSWDPSSDEEKARAKLIYRRFEHGNADYKNETTNTLVGGSYGPREKEQFKSAQEFRDSPAYARVLKPKTRVYFETIPEAQQLLFINRNFSGGRIQTLVPKKDNPESSEEKEVALRQGLASVEGVIGYLTDKIKKAHNAALLAQEEGQSEEAVKLIILKSGYEKELTDLQSRIPKQGATRPKPGGSGNISLLSIGRIFWDRFKSLSEEEQIQMIKDSTGVPEGATKSPIEQAHDLKYVRNTSQKAGSEYTSTLRIAEVTFYISSEHAYKFHEQGIDSHPGIAGTQKEVEFAVMTQALQRYRAKALPRSGAVGGISESNNVVTVNGINIVYLAWSPNPESDVIYIPDYMAQPISDKSQELTKTEKKWIDDKKHPNEIKHYEENAIDYKASVIAKFDAREQLTPLEIMTLLGRRSGNDLFIMSPDDWEAYDDFVAQFSWIAHFWGEQRNAKQPLAEKGIATLRNVADKLEERGTQLRDQIEDQSLRDTFTDGFLDRFRKFKKHYEDFLTTKKLKDNPESLTLFLYDNYAWMRSLFERLKKKEDIVETSESYLS
jgi:hypothetical protein